MCVCKMIQIIYDRKSYYNFKNKHFFFSSLDTECLEPSLHYIKTQWSCHKTLTFILGIKKSSNDKSELGMLDLQINFFLFCLNADASAEKYTMQMVNTIVPMLNLCSLGFHTQGSLTVLQIK